MPTFKTVTRGYKREDNTYSVYIRVTHNRKVGYMKTVFSIEEHELTKSGKIKNYDILEMCDANIRQYRKKCNELGDRVDYLSVYDIIKLLEVKNNDDIDFFKYSYNKIEEIKREGREKTAQLMVTSLNAFKVFLKKDNIPINSITSNLCREFYKHLESGGYNRRQSSYLSNIRALFNMAKEELNDDDLGIFIVKINPFKKFKIPKENPPKREIALDSSQMRLIYNFPYYKNRSGIHKNQYIRENMAKDVFVLSFFLVGMNTVDMYKLDNYDGEYISYNRSKTSRKRDDRAFIKIKVPEEAKPLMEKYKGKKKVFDFCEHYANPAGFNKNVNKGLKELSNRIKDTEKIDLGALNFYAARHSWATIARNDVKIDKYIVHEALNHSDNTMKITDIYIKKDFSHIDDANKKVIDFVFYD